MYVEQAVSSLGAIPAHVATFAAARGWGTVGVTLTRPGGGRSFTLQASDDENRLTVFDAADSANRRANIRRPLLGGGLDTPVEFAPTKIHMFGDTEPEPFIAVVVEFGFNYYRHLYIGNMVKKGSYAGGEVICGNGPIDTAVSFLGASQSYKSTYNKYLFSARHRHNNDQPSHDAGVAFVGAQAGGVNVVHASNLASWRRFDGPEGGNNVANSFDGTEVFGGAADNFMLGLLQRHGRAEFGAASVLNPINLFCPAGDLDADYRIRPIGHPAGVFAVNMVGLNPGQQIVLGTQHFRVFPEWRRTLTESFARGGGGANGFYFLDETSYMLGLAYPED
jgi:hypothetical protein